MIWDISMPEGAKGEPVTGPSWTEVNRAPWSDDYKRLYGRLIGPPRPKPRTVWNFDDTISGSFAEMRWEIFKRDPEKYRARYGEDEYQRCMERLAKKEEE